MPKHLLRWITPLLLLLLFAAPSLAQNQPPDYVISSDINVKLSANKAAVIVDFEISNMGGSTSESTIVRLVDPLSTINIEASTPLRPLASGDKEAISLSFSASLFPPNTRQPLRIEVVSGAITVRSKDFSITMPSPDVLAESPDDWIVELPGIGRVNLSDPQQLAVVAAAGGAVLILLLIVLVIFRLLFQRTPAFGTWQPPYANVPPMNPDTISGRRQLWQQHAQNGSLTGPCSEGVVQARKLLTGMDGVNLSGWRIIAIRMSQYDMYGRVARSQILAPNSLVNRLNRLARKGRTLDSARVLKQARPIAKGLAKAFKKRINQRSAMLPVALDVRFQGTHGEVRIVFELFQCQRNQWTQIDQWEPEMTVLSKAIHDSYTYTIYGQTGGETYREYRQRLEHDIARVLAEMVGSRPPQTSTSAPATSPNNPPVETRQDTNPNQNTI